MQVSVSHRVPLCKSLSLLPLPKYMAASVVGGSFLSAFLQVLFDRMASPEFLNLFRTQKAYDNLLRKLERKLDAVKAVLDDAENKEIRSPSIKKWLEKLHDTFYQADDLLDRINTEALRIKVETEYQSSSNTRTTASKRLFFERILPFTSSSNKFLRSIMPEIETIVETLEGCIQQIPPLGLQVVHSKRQSHQLFETPLVDDTSTFGRKADKEKVIQMLLSADANGDNVTVVPIVGLGGLGLWCENRLYWQNSRRFTIPGRAYAMEGSWADLEVV